MGHSFHTAGDITANMPENDDENNTDDTADNMPENDDENNTDDNMPENDDENNTDETADNMQHTAEEVEKIMRENPDNDDTNNTDDVAANMPATGASTHIAGTHTANMPSTGASTHIAADDVITANMLPTQHEDDVIAVNIPANRFGQLQVDDIPLELPKSTFSTVSFLQKVEHKK